MTDTPIAKPAGLTDASFFEARTQRVMFVNPPGSENFARVHSYGKSPHTAGSYGRDLSAFGGHPESGEDERYKLRKMRGMETELSVKGRPVK